MCSPAETYAVWFVNEVVGKRTRLMRDPEHTDRFVLPRSLTGYTGSIQSLLCDVARELAMQTGRDSKSQQRQQRRPEDDNGHGFVSYADVLYIHIYELCGYMKNAPFAGPRAALLQSRLVSHVATPSVVKMVPGWDYISDYERFMRTTCDNDQMVLPIDCEGSTDRLYAETWRMFVVATGLPQLAAVDPSAELFETFYGVYHRICVDSLGIDEDGNKVGNLSPVARQLMNMFPDMQRRAGELARIFFHLMQSFTFRAPGTAA